AELLYTAAAREPRARGRCGAPFAGVVRHLPGIPDEQRLLLVDLPVGARERHVVELRAREHAIEVPVVLRKLDDDVVVQIVLEPFRGFEEMDFVFHNWSADRAAILMPAEVRLRLSRGLGEWIHRVQVLIAIELEALAMELVRAALRGHGDGATGGPAVLGG